MGVSLCTAGGDASAYMETCKRSHTKSNEAASTQPEQDNTPKHTLNRLNNNRLSETSITLAESHAMDVLFGSSGAGLPSSPRDGSREVSFW